ncbi:MAG TPA: L-threonylcarbamoyladenylate synthase [Spirochaetota bacterium]
MILSPTDDAISQASDIIRKGGLVAIPTETVYGLAADALNPIACAKIFEAKKRPYFDPLIVHIADHDMIYRLASDIPREIQSLIGHFWPGPLTVIVHKTDLVPDIITSGLHTVALRMPRHPVPLALIRESGCPLAAPSANPFGYLSPTEARHVDEQLGNAIDLILDGGPCEVGVESTIVKYHDGMIHCLRPGGISIAELADISSCEVVLSSFDDLPEAPGQLPFHYSPHAQMILVPEGEKIPSGEDIAFCAFRKNKNTGRFARVEILSPTGNLREAAANLFSALHRLDTSGASCIYAEELPEEGLGLAVMNRLRKAAARRS